jgi:hypothetical protein
MMKTERGLTGAFGILREFARKKADAEHCELCSVGLAEEHPHLLELTPRRMLCACDACAMLFSGRTGSRYKRVPRDIRQLTNFVMTDAQWNGLMIPINLAFFFQSSLEPQVKVMYPSPAGATESLLPLEAWESIVEANSTLRDLEPDVEALLVNRVGEARGGPPPEYYVVPIDACYKLVGLIRLHWRGLSGGTEVWQEIGAFFAELRAKARCVPEEVHA